MKAGIAPDLDMGTAYTVQFTALSPTTGSVVAGVKVSAATLMVANVLGGNLDDLLIPLDPLWISLPVDAANG
jgi:hypothetical protein